MDEFISEKIKVREHNDNGAGAYYRCIALAYSESIGFQNYLRLVERSVTLQGVSFDPPQDSKRWNSTFDVKGTETFFFSYLKFILESRLDLFF